MPDFFTVAFFGLMFFFAVSVVKEYWYWRKKIQKAKAQTESNATLSYVVEQPFAATDFDMWLMEVNTYYGLLSDTNRKRFLRRVVHFMGTKNFEFIEIEATDKMRVLISAAAVQLTFGLEEFRLDFFEKIVVLKTEYWYGRYNMPFQGHVSYDGIYLSWDNFLKGYTNYYDAHNVGIHEMAHALTYVNFVARSGGEDDGFKKRFKKYSAVARPLYVRMKQGETNLLDSYAATNYNEFWAVSVETFFEKSLLMKAEMPELYEAICYLLNQDPLKMDYVIIGKNLA